MFKKILVPLDGSQLAEKSLPYVKDLARGGFVAEVLLIHVVEIPSVALSEGIDFFPLKNALFNKAEEYLADIESQIISEGISEGIKVGSSISEGAVAHSIVEYAKENGVDLIVIGTHGHTGMKDVVFGSVALRVLHESHVPVLLIK